MKFIVQTLYYNNAIVEENGTLTIKNIYSEIFKNDKIMKTTVAVRCLMKSHAPLAGYRVIAEKWLLAKDFVSSIPCMWDHVIKFRPMECGQK